jgi:hypothetical protein
MEKSGICPLVYYYVGQVNDQYGRSVITLRDYRGREVAHHLSAAFGPLGLPS